MRYGPGVSLIAVQYFMTCLWGILKFVAGTALVATAVGYALIKRNGLRHG